MCERQDDRRLNEKARGQASRRPALRQQQHRPDDECVGGPDGVNAPGLLRDVGEAQVEDVADAEQHRGNSRG